MKHQCLAIVAVIIGALAPAAGRGAEPKDDRVAATYIAEAERAYRERDYAAAVVGYQRAYGLNRNPALLLIIAHVFDRALDEPNLAASYYRLYLAASPGDDPSVRSELARAERAARMARLRLAMSPAEGWETTVDGARRGITPFDEPLVLTPGRHRLSLSREGRVVYETTVELSAGAQQLAIDLSPTVGASRSSSLPWAVTGLAAGATIAWGAAGAVAIARSDRDVALVSDVLLGVASGAAITSLILWVTR